MPSCDKTTNANKRWFSIYCMLTRWFFVNKNNRFMLVNKKRSGSAFYVRNAKLCTPRCKRGVVDWLFSSPSFETRGFWLIVCNDNKVYKYPIKSISITLLNPA